MSPTDELAVLERRPTPGPAPSHPRSGNVFLGPAFDYLLIGGGLSLLVTPFVLWQPVLTPTSMNWQLGVFLLVNYAHFAASTVRFYTKQGVAENHPWIAFGSPIIGGAIVTAAVFGPTQLVQHLWSLMMTWSPFHYAAQAYGLALIYCYRSQVKLTTWQKRSLWWIAMLPFFRAFLVGNEGGLSWFVSNEQLALIPMLSAVRDIAAWILAAAMFVLPVVVFITIPLPAI